MSTLAILRPTRFLVEALADPSRVRPSGLRASQVRGYAQKKKAVSKQKSQGFKGNKGKDSVEKKQRKEMKIGAFRAMPVNHLTDPVFRSEYRVELKLPTYSPESLTDAAAGTAMEFQKFENDVIRAYGVPKNLLVEFRVLSKPCSVIRDVTLTAIDTLDTAHDKPSRDSRLILTGPSGCGKSVLLLQAVEYCVLSNWIVLYIPRAISLVNSSTSFVYDDRTQTYLQPDYSFELLRRFLSVNSAALQTLTTQDELILEERSVPAGVTLAELVNAGLEDRASAPAVLSAFMSELSRQSAFVIHISGFSVQ
ncbi:hypothetical protein AcW1_007009 [Taiwanofungus camphoratus]|nr:hypothetical protein AcV5_002812 [Antrodia cinnamomea]KAI0929719.1 hypothetical protein AcV7_005185 [Antrodia cinnamomea]KAI0955417.1 hypothetical protein AcW1_007009 [Antrodia cinnamomea]